MRVAVIGGGVVGLLCAHQLQKRGADVVLLERDRIGDGCSAGNAGWVCPSISVPLPAPGLVLQSLRWMLSADSPIYIKPTAVPRMAGTVTAATDGAGVGVARRRDGSEPLEVALAERVQSRW